MDEIRITYSNADEAQKAEEARELAFELEDDGFESVEIVNERTIINEGRADAYQDGGQFVIKYV